MKDILLFMAVVFLTMASVLGFFWALINCFFEFKRLKVEYEVEKELEKQKGEDDEWKK